MLSAPRSRRWLLRTCICRRSTTTWPRARPPSAPQALPASVASLALPGRRASWALLVSLAPRAVLASLERLAPRVPWARWALRESKDRSGPRACRASQAALVPRDLLDRLANGEPRAQQDRQARKVCPDLSGRPASLARWERLEPRALLACPDSRALWGRRGLWENRCARPFILDSILMPRVTVVSLSTRWCRRRGRWCRTSTASPTLTSGARTTHR
mmetsp:Transcript_1498/g.3073  ORF Transcript_1498/g.3073 Transcript_1498/m.3073 type:complete len:217 (+) Transcript_1498:484-1134(+)